MKRAFIIFLSILFVAGCSSGPKNSANEQPTKEYKTMPITLEEFTENYNAVFENSSEITNKIDLNKKENGEIKVDDNTTIQLNDDGTMAGISYKGEPDTTIPLLILTSLNIRDEKEIDKMLGDIDHAASKKENFDEEAEVNGMVVKAEYADGSYGLFIEGK